VQSVDDRFGFTDDTAKTAYDLGENVIHRSSHPGGFWKRVAAYTVHLYTASGVVCVLLATQAVIAGEIRAAFAWMIVAVLIDATDGTFARRVDVKHVLPHVDGRKLDDIVDYLNYTFVPILMLVRADWLPQPAEGWAIFPLIASLFAFVHDGAKEEDAGFFRGFPSYWNIVAFYVAVWLRHCGPYVVLAVVLILSVLSVLPVRFVYPNRPPCWPLFFVGGGIVWLAMVLGLLWSYPQCPVWLIGISLIYPVCYAVLSVYLHVAHSRAVRSKSSMGENDTQD
jgi:phosphatidylcholine synthase